ncbi:hypothetical protein [Stratiformator vulcanicus]|uniref:Flagellar M-ring protein n=1 Tax=Stratiformator vulcanicus TaxID=2527980 RepID=A0A517R597_9PLAN|nr:hypothetical protein [Stratiformator vulcanicus]QDT39061.1 Flagellar M-ring protein [Stratiformator vulcanicus]
MDSLKKTWQQIAELFGKMSTSQRLTLIAVPVALLVSFGALVYSGYSGSYVALSWGKVFTTDELVNAEQTLIEAGLDDFHRKGQRLMVPSAQVEKYNAALLVDGNLPSQSMSEFEKQLEKSSMFTSREQLQAMKDVALQKELRTVLRAVPEIDDASVHWARSRAFQWPDRREKVTATVTLRPKRNHDLRPNVVRSVRAAVASMIPNLKPEDVTVFDQSTATAYTGDREGDPFNAKVIGWIEQHTRVYQDKIASALSYIPEVLVTVNVDVENVKSQIVREQSVDAKQTVTVASREVTRAVQSNEFPTEAEPGVQNNQPRSLDTQQRPTKSSKTEEGDTLARVVPSFQVTEKKLLSAMPEAVQVSISIPEVYYENIAARRGLTAGTTDAEKQAFLASVQQIKSEEESKVQKQVQQLIPAGSPETAVHVASITRIDSVQPVISVPITATLAELLREWGAPAILTIIGLWALFSVTRGLPREQLSADDEEDLDDPETTLAKKADVMPSDEEISMEPTERDRLQDTVRDNPDVAAAILGKWIQTVR